LGDLYIPLSIYQPHAMDGTITWLSPMRLHHYLPGQAFLILQHKTIALLAAQQSLDITLSVTIK
jgi:hypothetical protein